MVLIVAAGAIFVSWLIWRSLESSEPEGQDEIVVTKLEDFKKAQFIVNSTDKSLQLGRGGEISNTILRVGGREIQMEINEEYPNGITPREVALTKGYKLPYKYIIHCSLQSIRERISHHEITEIIRECLEKAVEKCYRPSIAFPVIGTGAMKFHKRILKTMYRTILEFVEENPNSLGNWFILVHPSRRDLIDYMKTIDPVEEKERLSYEVEFPSSWLDPSRIHRDELSEDNHDYQMVKRRFLRTIRRTVSIIKIERIINKRLYVAYKRYQKKIPNGETTTKGLWHGTKHEAVDGIIRYGYDWRLTERAVYGQGCYFAVDANYSDNKRYSVPNNEGEKCMFYTYVVAGKSIVADYTELTIPSHIQSTVNDLEKPTIFVTYNDDQQYPAFLVVYK